MHADPHGNGSKQGRTIVIGSFYNGFVQSLRGKTIFADRSSGKIWTTEVPFGIAPPTFEARSFADQTQDFKPDVASIDGVVGFAAPSGGRFFILDRDGELFEVVPES